MSILFSFFSRNSRLLLFLFLQILALFFTFNKNLYHNSLLESEIISFTGYIDEQISDVTDYLNLKQENERLLEENKKYRNMFFGKGMELKPQFVGIRDSANYQRKFHYATAEIVSNSLNKANNFLIIDKGLEDGVGMDMGVVTSLGVVGMVVNSTKKYSKIMSILNKNTKINARLKSSKYYGTLMWEGEDSRIMKLADIPKYVSIKIGDTIETSAISRVYPEGVLLGRVSNRVIDEETGNWNISVELFQDMRKLQNVYVVNRIDKEEIKSLQDSIK